MDRFLLWFAKWRLLPPPSSQNLPPVGRLTGEASWRIAAARGAVGSLLRLGLSAGSLAYQAALGVFAGLSGGAGRVCEALGGCSS